ncbi:MAG TPA: response regulator [Verrucomicrobiae bacterium]
MKLSNTKAKILVVEDEIIVSEDIQYRLRNLGYHVAGSADCFEEAVHFAEKFRPDLVLMDIMLKGGKNGMEAAADIRQRLHIPVVFLTGNADDASFQAACHCEPYGFILKPFGDDTLRVNIELAIYKYQLEQERESLRRQLSASQNELEALYKLLPICAWCHRVRDDENYWQTLEHYMVQRKRVHFSHGVCPACEATFMATLNQTSSRVDSVANE